MNVTDLDRYEMCMRYAMTMMSMAKFIESEYGKQYNYHSYCRKGMESCKMAIYYLDLWEQDSTEILKVA